MSETVFELLRDIEADQLIQFVRVHLEPQQIWSLKELQQAVRDLKEEAV